MFLHKFSNYNIQPLAREKDFLVENSSLININVPPPTMINLHIQPVCNMKCKMCYNWKPSKQTPPLIQINIWKKIITDLRKEFDDQRIILALTGSESLLNPDIFELIRYARNLKFDVWLHTNASLITKQIALKLKKTGLKNVSLSLDSFLEEEHNRMRGSSHSYSKVLKAIDLLYNSGIDMININCVICSYNIKNIELLVRWVETNQKISTITLQAITQPFNTSPKIDWFQSPEFAHLWPQNQKVVIRSLEALIRKKEKYSKLVNKKSQLKSFITYFKNPLLFERERGCNVKSKHLNISPGGEVSICPFEASGNLQIATINEIWNSKRHKKLYRDMEFCSRNCHLLINCAYEEENFD